MTIYHIHTKIMKWKHSKQEATLIKEFEMLTSPAFHILYFQKSNICCVCSRTFYNWRAFLLQCCFLFCLSINPSNMNSENLPNVIIHKHFTHKLGLGAFRETAWMNNFTTRRDNEQQSVNRVKIKLGEEGQGRRMGSGK